MSATEPRGHAHEHRHGNGATAKDEPLTFLDCLLACGSHREFVANFDRLLGCNLSLLGTGLDRMIDEASGRQSSDCRKFVAFVYETVWTRLPPEIRVEDALSAWAARVAAMELP